FLNRSSIFFLKSRKRYQLPNYHLKLSITFSHTIYIQCDLWIRRWRFIYKKIRKSRSENGQIHEKIKITNIDTEPTEPTSLGVCTRAAKTLALKRLNSSASRNHRR
ncbi:unnamed protein product, partial [Brassica oleracea]